MRILMLGTTFPRHRGSGVGKFIFELARALLPGNTVEVLTTHFPGGLKHERLDGVEVHRFSYFLPARFQRLTYPGGLSDQLKISWLARWQLPLFLACYVIHCARRMREADVVICNWVYTGTIMQLAARLSMARSGCIVVIRGSDMRLIERGGLISKLFIRTLKKADAVCVVARDFVETLASHGISNVHFTPNGIHVADFGVDPETARGKLDLNEKPVVLFAGSLIDRKDVATLVQAMRGIDAVLAVVGDGECRKKLEQQARDAGVDARFAGAIPVQDVSLWMAAATVFVLPSLYEGRANVLIEAMASRKTCIATNVKGSRELIVDGKSGFLIPIRSPEILHEKIQTLLCDTELRRQFEQASFERLRTIVPSWEESAANYLRIAEEIRKR